MESCLGKSIMSGVMGFGMGGLFGMFMASVRPLPLSLARFQSPANVPVLTNNRCPTIHLMARQLPPVSRTR